MNEGKLGRRSQVNYFWRLFLVKGEGFAADASQRTASTYIFGAVCPKRATVPHWSCRPAIPRRNLHLVERSGKPGVFHEAGVQVHCLSVSIVLEVNAFSLRISSQKSDCGGRKREISILQGASSQK